MNKLNPKKTGAAVFAVLAILAIFAASFGFALLVAEAADTDPVYISMVNIPGSVQSGSSFGVEVRVKNNTQDTARVTVGTANTSGGVIGVTTRERVEIELGAGAESTVSFDFVVSKVAANTVYEITFTLDYPGGTKSETRRISVSPPPPEPAAPQGPRFEKVTELYPKKVTMGNSARIGFRFANMGGPAYGVMVTISHNIPAGVEATRATVISVGTMLPGQSYDCTFEFAITDKAPAGMQVFTITVKSDSGASLSHPVSIMFEKGEQKEPEDETANSPDISIVSADIVDTVKKGEKFTIKAVFENSGGESGQVKVQITSPPGMANISPNIVQIDSLGQNARKEISFEIVASESVAENYNLFEIQYEYTVKTEGATEKVQKTQYVGLNVLADEKEEEEEEEEPPKDFSLEITLPESVEAGGEFPISVTVTNNAADEKNLYLKIEAPGGAVHKSANNFFIPELKSGQSGTYEATFLATEELAGRYILFCVSLYTKKPGGPDVVLADRYAGITVAALPEKPEETEPPEPPPKTAKVAVESILAPQNVNIGEIFEVGVTLVNAGSDRAENIVVSISMPGGIQNQTAATIKLDSLGIGGRATCAFTFAVTQGASYGYNAFTVELMYSSASGTGDGTASQYFGLTVNSSYLRIESVSIPGSVGINTDFAVEVTIKNTGADTTDVVLTLTPQGGLIHKSANIVKIDSIKEGETVTQKFVFMAPESAPDGYAPINIALSHGEDQITQYSGIIVVNPPKTEEEEEEDPKEDEKGDIPVVIISRFSCESESEEVLAVYGGKTFDFTLELLNTHKKTAVKDLKITFSQENGIFNPKSGSNTFFIEWLAPGETAGVSIPLLVKSDADPDSYGLTISLSYKNEKGESTSDSEIINIPVQQEMRFSVGDLPPINAIELGDEAYITVQFGNLGKSWIYNVAVRVQGEGFTNMEGTYYAGNIEKGKFLSKDFILVPYSPGYLSGSFVFTYEDADGNNYQEECPFSFMVTGGEEMWDPGWDGGGIIFGPDGRPIADGEGEDEEAGGFWLFTDMGLLKWSIVIGGGLVAIAAITVVIALIVRAKRKKSDNYDEEFL